MRSFPPPVSSSSPYFSTLHSCGSPATRMHTGFLRCACRPGVGSLYTAARRREQRPKTGKHAEQRISEPGPHSAAPEQEAAAKQLQLAPSMHAFPSKRLIESYAVTVALRVHQHAITVKQQRLQEEQCACAGQ